MPNDIRSLCDAILQHLQRLHRPVVDLLQPGLSDEEIRQLTASLPFALPDEVRELYAWRNGTKTGAATFGNMSFYPDGFLAPLHFAEVARRFNPGLSRWN